MDHAQAEAPDPVQKQGPRGFIRSLFAPHGHGVESEDDPALETSREGIRAVKISLAALLLTATVQLLVVFLSGSVALLGDTLHNYADALTSLPLWFAFWL